MSRSFKKDQVVECTSPIAGLILGDLYKISEIGKLNCGVMTIDTVCLVGFGIAAFKEAYFKSVHITTGEKPTEMLFSV